MKRIEAFHGGYTTDTVVGGNYFAVGRGVDITVQGLGRIQMNQMIPKFALDDSYVCFR